MHKNGGRIAVVYEGNLQDAKAWSGIPFYLMMALEKAFHSCVRIDKFGTFKWPWAFTRFNNLQWRFTRKSLLISEKSVLRSKQHGREIERRISQFPPAERPDKLLVIGMESIAYLPEGLRVVSFGDSIFGCTVDLFPDYGFDSSGYYSYALQRGHRLVCRAISQLHRVCLTSNWAIAAARNRFAYEFPDSKFKRVYIGANLSSDPGRFVRTPPSGQFDILLLASDWKRKGGDIALGACELLRARGVNATLHVVGPKPPVSLPSCALWRGQLYKDNKQHYAELDGILRQCHLMILPSRADCSPVSLCEGYAYGMPAVAAAVGGIPEMLMHERTGFLLSATARAQDYADSLLRASDSYGPMSQAARCLYETTLNWGRVVELLAEELYT